MVRHTRYIFFLLLAKRLSTIKSLVVLGNVIANTNSLDYSALTCLMG